MKYKLLIFDLDGTILDTLEDLTNSTNYALNKNGFAARSIDEVRSFVGNGIGKLIERAVPEQTDECITQAVLDDFREHYAEHCADNTCPYDGIVKLIDALRGQHYMTAVVSNKADFAVQDLCEKYFPEMFDYVVGEREGIRRKPAPDTVLEVLDKLNVSKENAIYIGDSEVDIQTAVNSEIDEIAVTWGFRDREYLESQGAGVIIDTPEDILGIIE